MFPIDSFHIHQFRGLRDLKLEGCGRINLLVGWNNVGKTTVLEALAAFAQPTSPSALIDIARRREFTGSRAAQIDLIRWLFPRKEEPAGTGRPDEAPVRRFELSGTGRHRMVAGGYDDGGDESGRSYPRGGRHCQATLRELETRLGQEPQRGIELKLWAGSEPQPLFKDTVARVKLWERSRGVVPGRAKAAAFPSASLSAYSHRLPSQDVEALSEAILNDRKPQALDLLRIFDPEVLDMEIVKPARNEPSVMIRHATLGNMPLSSFGDGMRRAFLLGMTLVAVRGGLLLVDEVESAIHQQALDRTFRWLRQACADLDVQLFLTTHSLEAIDALIFSGDPDAVVLFRLLQEGGHNRATRFSGAEIHYLREQLGQEVRG